MRLRCLALLGGLAVGRTACAGVDPGLIWAFPQEGSPRVPEGLYHVAGSPLPPISADELNRSEIPPDWRPDLHPPMPVIVGKGRGKEVDACSECHHVNGRGFLSTAALAGLPASYIIEQVHEFRDGRRVSSQPHRREVEEMVSEAKAVGEADLAEAAAYFASVTPQRWVEVVETDTVPRTQIGRYDWRYLDPEGGTEPIRGRIVELVKDMVALSIGDPTVVTTDYVPVGSVARGAALARRPNAGGQTCVQCHGETLQGTTIAPPLAGNAASYLARALWDIKSGSRQGPAVALMQPVVSGLTTDDITALTAYLASLAPASGPPAAYVSPVGASQVPAK